MMLSRWFRSRATATLIGVVVTALGPGLLVSGCGSTPDHLDVTDANLRSFSTASFSAKSSWDLAYAYDCGNALQEVAISNGLFGGTTLAESYGSAGFIMLRGLTPGTYSLAVEAVGCHWHLVAGTDVKPERLLAAVSASWTAMSPTNIQLDKVGTVEANVSVSEPGNSELLFAYDCGSLNLAGQDLPPFDLLYTNDDEGHFVSGSLVRLFAPRAWGWVGLRTSPFAEGVGGPGYTPPNGSESYDIGTACGWHVVVGSGLELQPPEVPATGSPSPLAARVAATARPRG